MDSKKYILIVDDEVDLAETMKEIFESEGYPSRCATSANEALKIIHEAAPCLIISDTNMPERSGLDLLEDIRSFNKTIPIAMVSGFTSPDKLQRATQLGVTDFLEKPIDFSKVLEMAKKAFAGSTSN